MSSSARMTLRVPSGSAIAPLLGVALCLSACAASAQPGPGVPTNAPQQIVLRFLYSISSHTTIMGMHNKDAGNPTDATDQVTAIAGRQPALWGGDFGFGDYTLANRQNMINEAVAQFNAGAVVALIYHACAPTGDESCTWDDIGGANPVHLTDDQWNQLITPGTDLYNNWISRLDTLSVYFQQLKDAGVAVLFRPFHEMNQCVFWWACRPGPKGSLRLYQITHDYLAIKKRMGNIIWVWNLQDFTTLSSDVNSYFPGNRYFDIAALDVYNTGYTQHNYDTMVGIAHGKPIAVAECQFLPSPSLLAQQNKWTYVMLWPDFIWENTSILPVLYNAPNALTLDQMPGWSVPF